eukprot:UN04565
MSSSVSCQDESEYVVVQSEEEKSNYIKFQNMVTISQKLYSSDLFKNKGDRSKRRKLLIRLRGLYNNYNTTNKRFEQEVVKCGWIDFPQWLQKTNVIKLECESDEIKLVRMMNTRKEINWSFIKGCDLDRESLKHLVDLTSSLMKSYYDQSKYLGPWNSQRMEEELTHKKANCIIIRNNLNDELIGYVSFRMDVNVINLAEEYYEFYVYELMINNKYQRKGYGEYLMNRCEF